VSRRTLLAMGAIVTIAGSLTIEFSVLLLLTPIPAGHLALAVLVGIALSAMGLCLLWLGSRGPSTRAP